MSRERTGPYTTEKPHPFRTSWAATPGAPSCGRTSLRWFTTSDKPRLRHPADHLSGSEGPLPGGAPDVDPPGVEDQDPGVQPRRIAANDVEGHFVVGGDQDGRVPVRGPQSVQPRGDAVAVPADPPPHLPTAQEVARSRSANGRGEPARPACPPSRPQTYPRSGYRPSTAIPRRSTETLSRLGARSTPRSFPRSSPLPFRHPFGSRSPIRGPSTPLTIVLSSSTLISERQHTFPSFSQPITASLSPPVIPALSRRLLGEDHLPPFVHGHQGFDLAAAERRRRAARFALSPLLHVRLPLSVYII